MKKTRLKKYAELIAKLGINVRKGQDVFIQAGLDQPEFVKMVAEECYKAGARKVVIDWAYQPMTAVNTKYRSVKTLSTFDSYEEERLKYYVENIPCRIYIESDDPDGLKHVNMEKMTKAMRNRHPITKKYRDQIENKYQWCIAAAPGEEWAKKVFPEMRKSQAVEKLWEKILECARVTDDPIGEWQKHNKDLKERTAYLNSLKIKSLHYSSKNGTDFTVGLIDGYKFGGGYDTSLQGISFNPNIPSEEVFVSPKKGAAEGIVYATRPLCFRGQLIDKFWIRFKEGKAVEWHAEQNNELLTTLITMDEGSAYLGECALVPFDSPIRNSEVLFYNTLFDENAACHLALGKGFMDTLEGFENMTLEEGHAKGINESMVHEDFMIGSEDLDIVATCADGKQVQLFRNGNWAF